MAGQSEHLFGPDWQIWQLGGWKLACHSSLQPGRCCCSLSSPILCFSQYIWATAAQNVEFHSWSVNTLTASGSPSPLYSLCYFLFAQDLLYCGRHPLWLAFCLHLPPAPRDEILILCGSCGEISTLHTHLRPSWSPHKCTRWRPSKNKPKKIKKSHKSRPAYLIVQRFKDLQDEAWGGGGGSH